MYIIKILIYYRKNFVQSTQQKSFISYTKNTQNIILLVVGFFAVVFGLYFISIQPNTTVLPTSNEKYIKHIILYYNLFFLSLILFAFALLKAEF